MSERSAARRVGRVPPPTVTDEAPRDRGKETQILPFLAFASFGFPALQVPRVGLPLNEVLPLLLCSLALARPAMSRLPVPAWFTGGLLLLLTELTLTSYLNHLTPARRLLHVALYLGLAVALASGRVHLRSAARGLGLGLLSSVVLALLHLGPSEYSGRLVGYLGDPNGGGYILTVLGTVAIGLSSRGKLRLALMVLLPVAVVLTYSRTSLLALAFAVVWVVLGRRLGLLTGLVMITGMVYLVGHIPPQLRLFGPFSDRSGSDALRGRIIAQEHADVALHPVIGSGAGSARVNVNGDSFFYHSSYLALQREGGLVAVAILVGLVGLVFLGLRLMPPGLRNSWFEASLLCLMVCAVNLGEVLLELPAAVALGIAMHHRLNQSAPEPASTPEEPPVQAGRDRPSRPRAR